MLQGFVCSWHECVQYEQQSVQAGLVPESKICILCSWWDLEIGAFVIEYEQQSVQAGLVSESKICILCSWWDFEIGAFVIVLVCVEIVCKMHRRVHHVTSWVNTRSWILWLQNTSATSEDFHYNSMIALELGPSICSSRVLLLGSCCQIHSPGFKGSQLLTMDGGCFWSCFEYAGKDMQSFKHTGIGILVCRGEQNFVLQESLSHEGTSMMW